MGGRDIRGKKNDVIVFDTISERAERKYTALNVPASETMFTSLNNACATHRKNKVIALVTRAQGESDGPSLIEYSMEENKLSLVESFR